MIFKKMALGHDEFKGLKEAHFGMCDREDTSCYIMWYINHAYAKMGANRSRQDPFEDLKVMKQFWEKFFFN